jgi:hypothetical protein
MQNLKNTRAKNNWKPLKRYSEVYYGPEEKKQRLLRGDPDTVYDLSQSTQEDPLGWGDDAAGADDDDDFVSAKDSTRTRAAKRAKGVAATNKQASPAVPPTPAPAAPAAASTSISAIISGLVTRTEALEAGLNCGPGRTTVATALRTTTSQLAQVKKTAAAATSKLLALTRRVEGLDRRIRDIETREQPADDVIDNEARVAAAAIAAREADLEARAAAAPALAPGAGNAGAEPRPEPQLSAREQGLRKELEAKNAELAAHQARELQETLVATVTSRVLQHLQQAPAQRMTALPAPSHMAQLLPLSSAAAQKMTGLFTMIQQQMAAQQQRRNSHLNFSGQ